MTPVQLRQLSQELPPFAAAAASPLLLEYCHYYSIDFSSRFPDCEHRAGRVCSGNYSLAVQLWRQPGASSNLLLLHGYLDHSGLFAHLIEYGLLHNANVLIFDLPGHGLSSGEPAAIDDFSDYSQAIADVLAAVPLPELPLWVLAQSTGAAALVDFARKQPWPFGATVLLAPLVRPVSWLRVRLAHTLLHRFIASVPREFKQNSSDLAFLDFLKRDPLQSRRISARWVGALRRWLATLSIRDLGVGPALIIQGDDDQTVDWRYNIRKMRTLFPDSHVHYLPGAGHQLANESAAMREQYLVAVEEWLALQAVPIRPSSR